MHTIFDDLAFIIFNYDCCLEHFLLNALQALYGIHQQHAADILGKLRIIHPIRNEIAEELEKAKCIIFLGFAFHTQNIRMLRPKTRIEPRHIFATAYGMSDADVDVVGHQLADFFKGSMSKSARDATIKIENKLKCAGMQSHSPEATKRSLFTIDMHPISSRIALIHTCTVCNVSSILAT